MQRRLLSQTLHRLHRRNQSIDDLRGRAVAVPLTRFGAAGLRRRDLAEPALERPLMAFPEAQEMHRSGSNWQVGSGPGNVRFGS